MKYTVVGYAACRGTIPRRKKKFASILCIPERFFDVIYSKELCELEKCKEKFYDYYGETGILKMRKLASKQIKNSFQIIYVFLTIFLYLLKCPQSLILSALRAFCFCGKPHISRSIFLYFRYQAWLKSW